MPQRAFSPAKFSPKLHVLQSSFSRPVKSSKRKKPPFHLEPFEKCVVYHESSDNRYAINEGGDESYYQWSPPTWQNAQRFSHVWFSSFARDSDLEKQTIVFRRYEPSHADEWTTVPECGG